MESTETGCVELGLRDDSSNPGQGMDVAEGSVTIASKLWLEKCS